MIVKSFKKCCISSTLDGSEDDVLWNDTEDDGERGNVMIAIVNMMSNAYNHCIKPSMFVLPVIF